MISLREVRHMQNKKIEEVAASTGINWNSLYQYEKKEAIPRFDKACKLMDCYGLTFEEMREYFEC